MTIANETDVGLRACVVELVATALLAAAVVGSGSTAFQTAASSDGLALLTHGLAVGAATAAFAALALTVSPGGLNPAIALAQAALGRITPAAAAALIAAQLIGAALGAAAGDLAHEIPPWLGAINPGSGLRQNVGEAAAAFAIAGVATLALTKARRADPLAAAIVLGASAAALIWIAAHPLYGNPALTLARSLTLGWAGLRWEAAAQVAGAQAIGAAMAAVLFGWALETGRAASPDARPQDREAQPPKPTETRDERSDDELA